MKIPRTQLFFYLWNSNEKPVTKNIDENEEKKIYQVHRSCTRIHSEVSIM